MFYATKQDKYIVEGTAFELDGVQYPAVWLNQSTAEQKAAVGLQEVVTTNSPADSRFYWVSETLDREYLTYTNIPKDLILLKQDWISQTKQSVYSLLQPTDYIDLRNLRDPEYKLDWIMWRESVRTVSANTVLAIEDAQNVDELIAVVTQIVWPHDPSYVAPVTPITPIDPTSTSTPI